MKNITSGVIDIEKLFEENADAIVILDSHLNIICWNKRMSNISGIDRNAALSTDFISLFPGSRREEFLDYIQRAISGKATLPKSPYLLNVSNAVVFVQIGFSCIAISEEMVGCMLTIRPTDISSVHHKLNLSIDHSPVATAIFKASGNAQYANKAFKNLFCLQRGIDAFMDYYNIFSDDQIIDSGLISYVHDAFNGQSHELPPVFYLPGNISDFKRERQKAGMHLKGYVYPLNNDDGNIKEIVLMLFDITIQKEAEEYLTNNHFKFHMLTSGLPGVIYELEQRENGQAKFKYISQGCEELFGYTESQLVEDPSLFKNIVHSEDYKAFIAPSYNNAERDWHWKGRVIIDGKEKWIKGKSNIARRTENSVIRYGLLIDVSDSKEVEERYKRSEERLQMALQGAEIGLWEWELDGKKVLFNKTWATKWGYDSQDLELRLDEWLELIHPEDVAKVKMLLADYMHGKPSYFEAEYRLRTKTGVYRWILDRAKATSRSESGAVVKMAGTYLDINGKKSNQLLIQRNELLFTQLFDNSPLGIVLLDDKHRVVQMNQGFGNIFGYLEDEIIGNQLNDILVPDELKEEGLKLNLLSTKGKVNRTESFRRHKNGDLIPVIIYGVPVNFGNKTLGIYGIYVDITERNRIEGELQIRNSELDNFVYKVSHDLRAPLSSVLGLINLAKLEQNEDDVRDYLKLIEGSVKQLDNFISDVLSHSKNLKLDVTSELIDLKKIINDTFADLGYLTKAGIINKEVRISGEDFYSDLWRVKEVFRNLISNAIKYYNPHLDNPYIKVLVYVNDENAIMRIEDNGIGIEAASQDRIFEMFYRATEYSQGSGIGLYIVKNAIEKLGGKISVESEPNRGTLFEIILPNKKKID